MIKLMTEIVRIKNIKNYTQEIINGELILTPKEIYITEEELHKTILTHSIILECIIKKDNNIISNKTKYRAILDDIWKTMPTQKILQTTTFNMKLGNENGVDGYKWCSNLHMSIQSKDAKNSMKEIINMINVNNYSIKMSIKLETGNIINFMK